MAKKNEKGQAVVEYVITVFVAVSIVGILTIGFRKSIVKFWIKLSQEIAAPCPGCPADEAIK